MRGEEPMDESVYRPEELLEIVTELARRFYGGDSTSISYDRAQWLMEGVLYCLREYENAAGNELRDRQSALPLREIYERGYGRVLAKTEKLRALYNELVMHFDDYGMICLRDTVISGTEQFLRHYDARYGPQETWLTLDYPILEDVSGLSGVDAVWSYVQCAAWEQLYLRQFDSGYIRRLLYRYHVDYGHLFENIPHLVLMNLAGHLAIGQPLAEEGFTKEAYRQLCRRFGQWTEGETEDRIRCWIGKSVRVPETDDSTRQDIRNYLEGDSHAITLWIRRAVEKGRPEQVFLL